jgi:hypothetical protein
VCTLSFNPSNRDFLVAMNRDELHSRQMALPPRIFDVDGVKVAYPREPSGGTWIACSEDGNLVALLNWHASPPEKQIEHPQTRGSLIPSLITAPTAAEVTARLANLHLTTILPFRLVGIFRSRPEVREWRWNGTNIATVDHPWARRHWFSSSISDARAAEERLRAVDSTASPSSRLDEAWFRNLHSSHSPVPGPFSVCVHRPDASTVSYTMVRCTNGSISMGYLGGSPCLRAGFDTLVTVGLRAGRMNVACA